MKRELHFTQKDDVLKRINESYRTLSKHHKTISDYIASNLEKVVDMTVNELAEETNTSVATVLRLTEVLGYDGYSQFRVAIQNLTKTQLTTLQRIHMRGFETYSFDGVKEILKMDMQNIKATSDALNEDTFQTVLEKIIDAERIYIIGSRTTSMLVEYLSYYFNLLLNGKAKLIQDNIHEPFEQLMNITPNDVALVLSFPRYSAKTYNYLRYCKKRETTVIGITDLPSSPIYPLCDYVLFARSNIISFVDTLVAPLSLVNALIVGVGLMNEKNTQQVLSKLEDLWDEYFTYSTAGEKKTSFDT